MTTNGGGYTIIAKSYSSSIGSRGSTPITTIGSGGQAWQVPSALASASTEILFHDRSGGKWANFTLDNATRTYLSGTSTSLVSINMPLISHSGYRVCSYTTLDQAAGVFRFDFSDGYGWNGTGFSLSGATNYYDSPLINSSTVHFSCEYSAGSYYNPANITAGIK